MTNQRAIFALLIAPLLFYSSAHARLKIPPPKTMEDVELFQAIMTDDYKKAVPLLERMAKKGNPFAQGVLGQFYLKGLGVKKDYYRAVELFEKASGQGDEESTFNLAMMYETGVGVMKDPVRGTQLFELASEQGSNKAPCVLAVKFYAGVGAPKDIVSAYAWANIGAAFGHEKCEKLRDNFEQEMSKTELESARRIAREWFSQHSINNR